MSAVTFEVLFVNFVRMKVFNPKYMTTVLIDICGKTNKEKCVLMCAPYSCLRAHSTVSNTIMRILDTQEPFRHFLILPENTYRYEV